ncbi:cell division protein FtsQ [Sedimentibacter acidaminivorans]|uniref:Cell division protein FtsQ n=1 Tax=Sedimentibacter acidaminivorans TaxID=913099 RepID=A0ABS4G908_9FIRM|nr:FtsQ-type POTRA domain-containing protein [Sedimentibacter acidaminivorans]MBP1924176.1 cell division protein FtsQ [Sedimentibacter acidaminivorans]
MAKRSKEQKKKRKKKRKIRKSFISTAAFFSAAVFIVFCIYHVAFKTDYLDIKGIDIVGNFSYETDYIIEKSGIELGEKIFKVDRSKVRENLEKEIYVKTARIVYELPDRIYIEINERQEQYQISFNNEYIIIDKDGVILNVYNEKSKLITIESFTDVIYNVGEPVEFKGIDDINTVFKTLEYSFSEFGSDTINELTVLSDNAVLLDTEYGAKIKINLEDDAKYQISFAMEIINKRLNNNLTVTLDLIDFTKGDSPVYIEDFQWEDI